MELLSSEKEKKASGIQPPLTGALEFFSYDNLIVKYFAVATVVWGVVGMTVGLTIALQLVFPALIF